jgi:hypothetical protein
MVDLPEIASLDRRTGLKIVSFDRIGDDLRILARL